MTRFRRYEEAATLAKNFQIIAVSRLLANQIENWDEFLHNTDEEAFVEIDRRQIKSQLIQSTALVKNLVKEFNRFFLHEASERVFLALFREIKASIPYGLRLPVLEFEKRFTPLRREVKRGRDQGRPYHATICITLTGLQYAYPEWHFSLDISNAYSEVRKLQTQLADIGNDPKAKAQWLEMRSSFGRQASLHRWCMISCFSLIESYLSGLAWRYQQTAADQVLLLSTKDRKTIDDMGCTFRDRLIRIPKIVSGRDLWNKNDSDVDAILEMKHIRDAHMHPSPFSQPDKYGGRDKLAMIYNLDYSEVEKCLRNTVSAIQRIFLHVYGSDAPLPEWLADLYKLVNSACDAE